jgi:hypothetical protein
MASKPLPYQTNDTTKVAHGGMQWQTLDPSRSLLQNTAPAAAFDWSNIQDSMDPHNLDMRDDTTIAYNRTAARTGTSFDAADLLTNGTATKLQSVFLPQNHPAMQVIRLNEATMPGDVLGASPGLPAATEPIEQRIAQIVCERSLDLVNLMDDFLKRPAYSRMPTRNRAFFDVSTFRRAICYAMGDQWTRLAMTTDEFKSICLKHLRTDAAHGSQSQDAQGFGQPEPLILWQPFANGIMQLADGDKYKIKRALVPLGSPLHRRCDACCAAAVVMRGGGLRVWVWRVPVFAVRGELDDERYALWKQADLDAKAAEAEQSVHDSPDIGKSVTTKTSQASKLKEERQRAKAKEDAKPMGKRGARVGEVNRAKVVIRDRLLEKNSNVRKVLKDLDEDASGILSRDEIKKFLREQNLLKFFDFYTGETRGELDPKAVDTLLDMVRRARRPTSDCAAHHAPCLGTHHGRWTATATGRSTTRSFRTSSWRAPTK